VPSVLKVVRYQTVKGYGVAVAAVTLAMLVRLLLIPLIGEDPDKEPFLVFFAAVIISAWFGGLGPGLLATTLSALVSDYSFLYPQYEFRIERFELGLRLTLFVAEGVFTTMLVHIMRNARQRTEEALETRGQSEERFRSAFENAPIGVALVGLDRRHLKVNRAYCEMLGYSEEELLEKVHPEIIHPDDREKSSERLQQALEGEAESYTLERRYLHADGHVV
jgi:PAS domain S-box-containing protein